MVLRRINTSSFSKLLLFPTLVLFFLLINSTITIAQNKYENLFYMVDTQSAFQSFKQHINQISVIAPQTYYVDQEGVVWGSVDPRVISLAGKHNVKVMPLLVNNGFSQKLVHQLLSSDTAKDRIIHSLLQQAEKYHYWGWQFDIEDVNVKDRSLLTSFYKQVADSLHQHGFKISIAVVPSNSSFAGPTSYHRFMYENWRGAYNYKKLADYGDFLSLMTYSEHTRLTPPGPVAGLPWMTSMVKYLMKLGIPASKISLGIPFYSNYWYPAYSKSDGAHASGNAVDYKTAENLIHRYKPDVVWLKKQQCYYAIWDQDGIFEYLFLEEKRSFRDKLELLKKYHLRGISVWRLGQGDPADWPVLKRMVRKSEH